MKHLLWKNEINLLLDFFLHFLSISPLNVIFDLQSLFENESLEWCRSNWAISHVCRRLWKIRNHILIPFIFLIHRLINLLPLKYSYYPLCFNKKKKLAWQAPPPPMNVWNVPLAPPPKFSTHPSISIAPLDEIIFHILHI